jgi:hypothetical protein
MKNTIAALIILHNIESLLTYLTTSSGLSQRTSGSGEDCRENRKELSN